MYSKHSYIFDYVFNLVHTKASPHSIQISIRKLMLALPGGTYTYKLFYIFFTSFHLTFVFIFLPHSLVFLPQSLHFDICHRPSLSISIHPFFFFHALFRRHGVFIISIPAALRAMHRPDRWAEPLMCSRQETQTRQLFSSWTRHIAFLLLFSNRKHVWVRGWGEGCWRGRGGGGGGGKRRRKEGGKSKKNNNRCFSAVHKTTATVQEMGPLSIHSVSLCCWQINVSDSDDSVLQQT